MPEQTAVRTRFAPSPSGYLHIGGARTALFSWAYAQQQGGEFFLRIEDTDAARSSPQHSAAIIGAMEWLGLHTDAPPIFQSDRHARHRERVEQLLDEGRAYRCYATPEELAALREAQLARGENPKYDRRWRDSTAAPPPHTPAAVRFKMPLQGETTFPDAVKGALTVANSELDDFIIARADGSPTYNLAAVVDDIDMGISHVIRGDDHVMNTYRQWHLFCALVPQGAAPPQFAHLPMIFTAARTDEGEEDEEGGNVRYVRMSKRHAAVDIAHYRREGFLPQALCNYLARLSWGHGDAEVFTRDFFVRHFSFAAVSQSPARFDWDKLKWLNREHLRQLPAAELRSLAGLGGLGGRGGGVNDEALTLIRSRGDTLNEIKSAAAYFEQRPPAPQIRALLGGNTAILAELGGALQALPQWAAADIKKCIKTMVSDKKLDFKEVGMPLRIALTGQTDSPDVAAVAAALGRQEVLERLKIAADCG